MRFDFTTLDATGRTGPQNISAYEGSSLEGRIQLARGIQIFAAPVDGNYVIEAWGASGANGTCGATSPGCVAGWRLGGLGARIRGTFHLNAGTKFWSGKRASGATASGNAPGVGAAGVLSLLMITCHSWLREGVGVGGFLIKDPNRWRSWAGVKQRELLLRARRAGRQTLRRAPREGGEADCGRWCWTRKRKWLWALYGGV